MADFFLVDIPIFFFMTASISIFSLCFNYMAGALLFFPTIRKAWRKNPF
jgi:hypothetical protein